MLYDFNEEEVSFIKRAIEVYDDENMDSIMQDDYYKTYDSISNKLSQKPKTLEDMSYEKGDEENEYVSIGGIDDFVRFDKGGVNYKTNGDVLREKLSKMSDEKLEKILTRISISEILGKRNICEDRDICRENCIKCILSYLSQPYEESKKWYLYRYSSKRGKEIYISNWETTAVRKNEQFTEVKECKELFTFEEVCEIRTVLNVTRQHKKNLWCIAEEEKE